MEIWLTRAMTAAKIAILEHTDEAYIRNEDHSLLVDARGR